LLGSRGQAQPRWAKRMRKRKNGGRSEAGRATIGPGKTATEVNGPQKTGGPRDALATERKNGRQEGGGEEDVTWGVPGKQPPRQKPEDGGEKTP